MKKYLFPFLLMLNLFFYSNTIWATSTSSMIAKSLYSPALNLDWNYTIYLPADYNPKQTYPVLYLLHGAYGNHRNLIERFPIQTQLDELIQNQQLKPLIVVFVDGFNSFYLNSDSMQMESAIIDDLIPQIEATYAADKDRSKRYIGGISMGGYGAANLTFAHPELFSKTILISPAIWHQLDQNNLLHSWHLFDENGSLSQEKWNQNHPEQKLSNLKNNAFNLDLILLTGKKDQVVKLQDQFLFEMRLRQYPNIKLKTVYDEQGEHNWAFWEVATKQALLELH